MYQAERYGNFAYTVPGLLPGGSYAVRLHFAEIYWNAPRARLFNVAINGTQVLSNSDIFAAAGGANRAVVESFAAVANGSGQIVITFTTIVDNAKVSGIEILPAYTPGVAGAPQEIDAGGGAAGGFAGDADFSGLSYTYATSAAVGTPGVSNPAPGAVYQTERYGKTFAYTLAALTPGAGYWVRLHFAEIYWRGAGRRIFNVTLNGNPVLSNFDIFAAVGADAALVESFPASTNAAGQIVIGFTTLSDNAKISGIELEPGSQTAPPPPPTGVNITTHHFDTLRSGWNAGETSLTPASVASSFGLLHTISLDEQVDAQPLVVSSGSGTVLYVATENDALYALDGSTGATLWQRNFGAAVPQSALPGGCGNNSAFIGINSTPVIDLSPQHDVRDGRHLRK